MATWSKSAKWPGGPHARPADRPDPSEAVFMLHGFGHQLPVESRAFGKGVADHELMCGGLDKWDKGGGAIAMQEHFVSVARC